MSSCQKGFIYLFIYLKKNLNWSESLGPLFSLSCSSLLECCNSGPNPSWVFQFPALSKTPRERRKNREENDDRRGEETLEGRKGRHWEVGMCRLWLLSALAAAAPVQTFLPSPRALVTSPGHQACPRSGHPPPCSPYNLTMDVTAHGSSYANLIALFLLSKEPRITP